MSWFRWDNKDLILQLKIQPGAQRSEFVGLHGEYLKAKIHAPALAGRANAELVSFLSTQFDVSKSDINLEQGELGRVKRVRITMPQRLPDALWQWGLQRAS